MTDIKTFTREDVAAHKVEGDVYVILHGSVYDVTGYVKDHPGGEEILMSVAGQDGTEGFDDIGHSDDAKEQMRKLKIGNVQGEVQQEPTPLKTDKPAKSVPATRVLWLGLGYAVAIATSLFFILVVIGLVADPECTRH